MQRRQLTLCIIHQHPRVLLGMKKRGFGKGRWNGFGGKVQEGESVEEAMKREIQEESGLRVEKAEELGVLEFRFAGDPEIQEVHVFKAIEYAGDPVETEEMSPQWFFIDEIPFEHMWPDDLFWFPLFMRGKRFQGSFTFQDHDKIMSYTLKEV